MIVPVSRNPPLDPKHLPSSFPMRQSKLHRLSAAAEVRLPNKPAEILQRLPTPRPQKSIHKVQQTSKCLMSIALMAIGASCGNTPPMMRSNPNAAMCQPLTVDKSKPTSGSLAIHRLVPHPTRNEFVACRESPSCGLTPGTSGRVHSPIATQLQNHGGIARQLSRRPCWL